MNDEPPVIVPLSGKKFAVGSAAALSIGVVLLIVFGLAAYLLIPLFVNGRGASLREYCMGNEHEDAVALKMYALDWDSRLPQSATWMNMAAVYLSAGAHGTAQNPDSLHCPAAQLSYRTARKDVYGYAFNSNRSGKTTQSILNPEQTFMMYDSTNVHRNATDPGTSIDFHRHLDGANIAFVDGHSHWVKEGTAVNTYGHS